MFVRVQLGTDAEVLGNLRSNAAKFAVKVADAKPRLGEQVPDFGHAAVEHIAMSKFLEKYDRLGEKTYYMNAFDVKDCVIDGPDTDLCERKGDPFASHSQLRDLLPKVLGEDDSPDVDPGGKFRSVCRALQADGFQCRNLALWFSGRIVNTPLHYDEYLTMTVTCGSGSKTWWLAPPEAEQDVRGSCAAFTAGHPVNTSGFRPWVRASSSAVGSEAGGDARENYAAARRWFQTVTVGRGDVLLVPPGWWHAVVTEGRCVAVNWWWMSPDRAARHAAELASSERLDQDDGAWTCAACTTSNQPLSKEDAAVLKSFGLTKPSCSHEDCRHIKGEDVRIWRCPRCHTECKVALVGALKTATAAECPCGYLRGSDQPLLFAEEELREAQRREAGRVAKADERKQQQAMSSSSKGKKTKSKKPQGPPSTPWACPTCTFENPKTALKWCKVCDSQRPAASVPPSLQEEINDGEKSSGNISAQDLLLGGADITNVEAPDAKRPRPC